MQCNYQLRWFDLVPVLSYIILGGKCRKCKTKISIQYPLIELLNGAAYLGMYSLLGLSVWTVLCCFVFSILLVIFFIDLRHMIIPNGLVISILVLAVGWVIYNGNYVSHIIGLLAVPLFLLLLAVATKGRGMGMGDIKLMAASGLLLGWQGNFVALMTGSVLGSIIGVGLMAFGVVGRKQHIPFGPFLAVGILVSMLFGDQMVQWYMTSMLNM